MQTAQKNLGLEGENFASDYLKKRGYKILHRNWRFDRAELDIVAEKDNFIIVVEVKARSTDYFEKPEMAVTPAKIKQLCKATNAYLEKYDIDKNVRFDIIALLKNKKDNFSVKHFKDAFYYF